MPPVLTPTQVDDLRAAIDHWGNLQWRVGVLAGQFYAGLGTNNQQDAEIESQRGRDEWTYPLLAALDADGEVTTEQEASLFAVIDAWGQELWLVGFQTGRCPDDEGIRRYETEVAGASRALWRAALMALVE